MKIKQIVLRENMKKEKKEKVSQKEEEDNEETIKIQLAATE